MAKLRIKHTQTAKEGQIDLFKSDHAAEAVGL